MKLSDFLIIYLACGTPVAIYFFLQHRHKVDFKRLYLKSFFLVFVWIPYALRLLYDFVTKRSQIKHAKKSPARKLDEVESQICKLLFESNTEISVFDVREVLERYAGLTNAYFSAAQTPSKTDEEIFRIALRQNIKLGSECLLRRNRLRIQRHQDQARQDFLSLVEHIWTKISDKTAFECLIRSFVQILSDKDSENSLQRIFGENVQSKQDFSVQSLESELWTLPQKPLQKRKTSARLQTLMTISKD